MLYRLFSLVTAFGLIYLVLRKRNDIAQKKVEDIFADEQGCRSVHPRTQGRLPFAIDLAKELWAANADQRLLAYQQLWVDKLGNTLDFRILGGLGGLVTSDPENMKAILSKSKFREGKMDFFYGKRRDALLPLLGEGLFTQDGPAWKYSRELLRKQFARISYQNLEIFGEHVELLVARLSGKDVVDLQPYFFDFTLDTTTSLLFGESAGSLREDHEDQLSEPFAEASWISFIRAQLADLYWIYSPRRYTKACKRVKAYADFYVEKALEPSNNTNKQRYSFIQSLHHDLKDRKLVRDQLVNVLIAGRDTTACCLSWTFRLLVRHDKVLARLRGEIHSVLGSDKNVSKSKVRKLPYLKFVLLEALRLYPSVPINLRAAAHTTALPRGGGPDGQSPVLVRKGGGVGLATYHMHMRKDLYGDDAREFRPERWENGSLQEDIGWGYLPFSGGPRSCLGQEFAMLEASYAIIRIIQSFPNITLPAEEKVEPFGSERRTMSLAMSPADGCRLRLR